MNLHVWWSVTQLYAKVITPPAKSKHLQNWWNRVRNADQLTCHAKANFLVLITYCNYVRCHHWVKLSDRNTGPLCTIFWRGCRYTLRRKTYTLSHHFTPITSVSEGQKVWYHTVGKNMRKQVFTYTAGKSVKWLMCTSVENRNRSESHVPSHPVT